MGGSNSGPHTRIKAIDEELERFERQAVLIFIGSLTLAFTSYSILVAALL